MREYLLCLVAAAAITYVCTPLARSLALRVGALAEVRERDVHDTPTPRLGGLAMFAGFAGGLAVASQLPVMRAVFVSNRQPFALMLGAVLIVALGVADDKWGLDAPTKFAGQALAGAAMAFTGIQVIWLPVAGTLVLDPMTSVLLTVMFVILTVNAVNFIDGLDGLAAGIVGIAALAIFAYAYLLSIETAIDRVTMATLICALLAGICLGFLPHNINPARIFMGDTGSMLIGYLLAAAMITLTGQVDPGSLTDQMRWPTLLPLVLPAAVVAVPLLDVTLAVVRRTRARRSPFAPDKQHLHHRLLEMGHSQRRAVGLMYGWAALIAFTAVSLAFVPPGLSLIGFLIGVLILAVAVVVPRGPRSAGP